MRNTIKRQTNLKWLSPTNGLLFILAILLFHNYTWAQNQERQSDLNINDSELIENYKKVSTPNYTDVTEPSSKESTSELNYTALAGEELQKKPSSAIIKDENKCCDVKKFIGEKFASQKKSVDIPDDTDDPQIEDKEKFHWKPALIQSGIFLGIQQGYRIATQVKTRRELDGPFFKDWAQSVKNLRGWNDGNKVFTNYIGHPLQGGITGRIFVNNSDMAKSQEFGKAKKYWESRFKAMAWSAFWSTQFELGPISEASLGNVGMYNKKGPSLMAWTDLVITPFAGTGVLIGEDAIDKYVLKNWIERKSNGKVTNKVRLFRTVLTPTFSISNLLRGKMPWKRETR